MNQQRQKTDKYKMHNINGKNTNYIIHVLKCTNK